jgi:phage terminase large subunit
MILGLVPETVRGKIYSGWREIESVPFEARLIRRGLDFGYSNDPTALVDIYEYNGGYILDEQLYRKGMLNKQIADYILNLPHNDCIVVADSAEPKSIDEIKLYGVTILPATKGTGSINSGIAFIKGQKISYTKRSINLKKEYENYAWFEDKEGITLNKPKDEWNHTMDAIRYGLGSVLSPNEFISKAEVTYHY